MSLDNTSHPGGPGHDELVPSRYALRVGEIDVLVVSDGVLSLPGAMLAHNADPAVRAAWLKDMFLPPDVLEWALNVVVVRSGGRTILIDAGMGVEYPDLPRTGRLALRLEAAGIDLASVTDVVLTHMHMDHVGGLLADGVKARLRPDLRVHVAAAEAEFWASPDFSRVSMPPGFPDALRSTAKRFLNAYHSQLRPFEAEHEVAPGVVVHQRWNECVKSTRTGSSKRTIECRPSRLSRHSQEGVSTPRDPVPSERRRRRPPRGRRTGTTGEWPPATRGSPPVPAEGGPGPGPPPRDSVRSR